MKTLADVVSREGQRDVEIGYERNDRACHPRESGHGVIKMRPKSTLDGSSRHGPRSRYGDSNLDADALRQMDTSKYLRTNLDEYLQKGDQPIDGISTQSVIKAKLNKNQLLSYKYNQGMKSSYNQYFNV